MKIRLVPGWYAGFRVQGDSPIVSMWKTLVVKLAAALNNHMRNWR